MKFSSETTSRFPPTLKKELFKFQLNVMSQMRLCTLHTLSKMCCDVKKVREKCRSWRIYFYVDRRDMNIALYQKITVEREKRKRTETKTAFISSRTTKNNIIFHRVIANSTIHCTTCARLCHKILLSIPALLFWSHSL